MEGAPGSIFADRPVASAVVVAAITLASPLFLPPALSVALAAIVVGAIADVIVGVGLIVLWRWKDVR